jgi:hypothetical protein
MSICLFLDKAALVWHMDNIQERQPSNLLVPFMPLLANFQEAWRGVEG